MLVFCHLLIGTILGLLAYRLVGRRVMVLVAALGSILPDMIDKPLGHLLLQSTLDSGRIYAHTLLFLGMVAVAGAVAWRYKITPLVLVLALGITSHLVLDMMWDNPVTLLWPALGPFVPYHYPGYFETSFITEITSPLEWLFGASFAIIMAALYRDRLGTLEVMIERTGVVRLPLFGLLALAGIVSILALLYYPVGDLELPARLMAAACAIAGGGFLISRERHDTLVEGPGRISRRTTLARSGQAPRLPPGSGDA